MRPLRFARALDCYAICAASLRKLRFLRRISRQSPDWLRLRPLRDPALSAPVRRLAGAESRAVGAGAFGRSGGVRACRRVSCPACGGPRIRRMRDIPPRRNTAFAACPRPGGADGRPAVREPLGRASAPVPPLRAISPCVAIFYDAAARRLHLPCRPASMRIVCGINISLLAGEGKDFIRTVVS